VSKAFKERHLQCGTLFLWHELQSFARLLDEPILLEGWPSAEFGFDGDRLSIYEVASLSDYVDCPISGDHDEPGGHARRWHVHIRIAPDPEKHFL
jgi:hypothetical protein